MTFSTLQSVLQLAFLYGVPALAVSFAFRIIGFPDLTPDGSFTIGAAVAAVLVLRGTPATFAVCIGSFVGAAAGITTALLHTRLGISKLLSGILVMLALYSVSLRIMGTSNLSLLNVDVFLASLARQSGLAPVAWTFVVCFVAVGIVASLLSTRLGIGLRATGDSETALGLRGRSREPYYIIGLAFANALSATGGAMIGLYQGFVDISMGTGLVVTCLAAIVMGETVLRPAKVLTLILSPVVGMFLYQLVLATALQAGLSPADLKISTALLALSFLALDRFRTQHGTIGRQIGNRAF